MADSTRRWTQNTPGKWYVDDTCITCDACTLVATDNFAIYFNETETENRSHAFVRKQPENEREEALCEEARQSCPVEAIGCDHQES